MFRHSAFVDCGGAGCERHCRWHVVDCHRSCVRIAGVAIAVSRSCRNVRGCWAVWEHALEASRRVVKRVAPRNFGAPRTAVGVNALDGVSTRVADET